MVRTFYTFRKTPRSDVEIWYADEQFGFYESVPKRVAEMLATHVTIEVRNQLPLILIEGDLTVGLVACLVSEKVGY